MKPKVKLSLDLKRVHQLDPTDHVIIPLTGVHTATVYVVTESWGYGDDDGSEDIYTFSLAIGSDEVQLVTK